VCPGFVAGDVERCAGLDVHRDNVVATVRVLGDRRGWRQETRTLKGQCCESTHTVSLVAQRAPAGSMLSDPVSRLARSGLIGAWAERVRASLRLLPVLLAAECTHVEVVVRAADLLGAAAVGRVGVEDAVAVAQEHARAMQLTLRCGHPQRLPLCGGAVVVDGVFDGCIEGDAVVEVEAAAEARVPGKGPAIFRFQRSIFSIGARDTTAIVVSRSCK
jgi:hypothetical protein